MFRSVKQGFRNTLGSEARGRRSFCPFWSETFPARARGPSDQEQRLPPSRAHSVKKEIFPEVWLGVPHERPGAVRPGAPRPLGSALPWLPLHPRIPQGQARSLLIQETLTANDAAHRGLTVCQVLGSRIS